MPRVRPLRRIRAGTSDEQEGDLLNGRRGAFASEADRRAAWVANRERLIGMCNPTTRPAAFFDYEFPGRDPNRSMAECLYVAGLLTPAEKVMFEAWCRRTHLDPTKLPAKTYRAPDPRTLFRA